MGRHTRMRPAAATEDGVVAAPVVPVAVAPSASAARSSRPRSTPNRVAPVQRGELVESLSDFRPHGVRGVDQAMIDAIAQVVAAASTGVAAVDRVSMGRVCRLAVADRAAHGDLNLARAFLPESLAFYVQQVAPSRTVSGLRTLRSELERLGRSVHPGLYPAARPKMVDQGKLAAPYTPSEVRRLYAFAFATTPGLSARLLVVLDLTTGVGARSVEITDLRGGDV